MTGGAYRNQFWGGGVLVGILIPLTLTIVALAVDITSPALVAIAGGLALVGMFAYEDSFVRAGQSVPLS